MIESVRILGIDYPIQMSPEAAMHESAGTCNNVKTAIHINDGNSPGHALTVLLHEILEAILYRMQIEMDHDDLCRIEAGLYQVLRDNPGLVGMFGGRDVVCGVTYCPESDLDRWRSIFGEEEGDKIRKEFMEIGDRLKSQHAKESPDTE